MQMLNGNKCAADQLPVTIIVICSNVMPEIPFSALTLLVAWQHGHRPINVLLLHQCQKVLGLCQIGH